VSKTTELAKKFDKSLYQKFDKKAKDVAVAYLKQNGYDVYFEPFGKFDVDLGAKKDGKGILVEVEVRENWSKGSFPFRTIHLPKRKEKFLDHTYPVFFYAFRSDLKRFVVIPGEILEDQRVVMVSNKYMSNEKFFDIPITSCEEISLQGGEDD